MAFRLKNKREVWYPVEIPVLRDDGSGEVDHIVVKIKYHILTRKEYAERMRELTSESTSLVASLNEQYQEDKMNEQDQFVIDRVTDWDEIEDEKGQPIKFSKESLRAAMWSSVAFAKAVNEGLYAASRDAPVKNS